MQIKFDLSAMQRVADRLKVAQDQVPFAMARALNDAAFETRRKLIEQTWPRAVTVRAPNFPAVALYVEKADKRNLAVAIVEQPTAVSLALHAEGGTKTPRKARRFAVPH
jgi:tRNA A37 threonylcarbamoyladenosine synthetase subunit TsaC/SUA5/YrdC